MTDLANVTSQNYSRRCNFLKRLFQDGSPSAVNGKRLVLVFVLGRTREARDQFSRVWCATKERERRSRGLSNFDHVPFPCTFRESRANIAREENLVVLSAVANSIFRVCACCASANETVTTVEMRR